LAALVGSGRSADVYEHEPGWVLRRYREPRDTEREVAGMEHARANGFPVPEAKALSDTDIVMQRLEGPTMLDDLERHPWLIERHASLLGSLHRQLHAIEAPEWLPAPVGDGTDLLHLDLHPDNVMLTVRGPVVIDWRDSDEGPADRDVAMTALILAQVTLWEDPPLVAAARAGLDAFHDRVATPRRRELDHVVAMRRRNPAMTAQEVADLDRAAALVRTVDG
jgi:aminoglycoside phosphotransferase (APT) family kinase protein